MPLLRMSQPALRRALTPATTRWAVRQPGFPTTVRFNSTEIDPPSTVQPTPGTADTFSYQLPSGQVVTEPARPRILRPILFTLGVGLTAFTWAAYRQEESEAKRRRAKGPISSWLDRMQSADELVDFNRTPQRPKLNREEMYDRLRRHYRRLKALPDNLSTACLYVMTYYHLLPPNRLAMYTLVGLNVAVFGLWRIPRLQAFMGRHFLHHARSGRSYTLLTSTFSHQGGLHLMFNMMGLYYFVGPVAGSMTPETFPAFYVTAGTTASLVYHLGTLAFVNPASVLPCLGASGAVYAIIALFSILYPQARLQFILFPFVSFESGPFFKWVLAAEAALMTFTRSSIAHGAHLAGAAFGFSYHAFVPALWTGYREWVGRMLLLNTEPRKRS